MSLGVLGGMKQQSRPRAQAGMGSVGLGALTIPSNCWDKPGFKDCNTQGWNLAEQKCRSGGQPSTLAVQTYGGNVDACKQAQADEYLYYGCALRICPPPAPARPTSYGGWTWMSKTANPEIKTFQEHLNVILKSQGYKPITADGKMGPSTCGAFNFVDPKKFAAQFPGDAKWLPNIQICQSFTNPTKVGKSTPEKLPVSPEAKKLDQQFGGLPWLVADPRVADLQAQLNRQLDSNGFLPIKVSGMLDPPTCGAILWLDQNTGSNLFATWGPRGGGQCPSVVMPTPKPVATVMTPQPVGPPVPGPVTTAPGPANAPPSGSMSALAVGLLAAVAVGGVVWWKSKTGGA